MEEDPFWLFIWFLIYGIVLTRIDRMEHRQRLVKQWKEEFQRSIGCSLSAKTPPPPMQNGGKEGRPSELV
jgi:hypothetical protein